MKNTGTSSACVCLKLTIVFSGFATIENEMAAVIISQIACEQMYTIIAGGIIIDPDYELIGPQFRRETISAPACPSPPTPSSTPTSKAYVHILYTYMY